jgi:DMSO/TMAO reductase YedYZ molybdopterin-dependent catalytic subunit
MEKRERIMKRTLPILAILAVLALLLGACGGDAPEAAAGDVLVVTDGMTTKSYTAADLQALPAAQAAFREVTYTGVPLAALLADAGFEPGSVSAVKATAADGFSANYDPVLTARADTLVAYAQSDGPLSAEDGTFRMVLPDQEGKMNPRNLVEITVIP